MKISVGTVIQKPPAEVFDKLADNRNEVSWNNKVSEVKQISTGPIQQGSQFSEVYGGDQFVVTITEYNQPQSLKVDAVGKQMSISCAFSLSGPPTGPTTLRAEFDMRPHGLVKIAFPLMALTVRKNLLKQYGTNFKQFCEK